MKKKVTYNIRYIVFIILLVFLAYYLYESNETVEQSIQTRTLNKDGFCVLQNIVYTTTTDFPCPSLREDALRMLPSGYTFVDYVYKIQNVVKKDPAFKYVPPQEKTTTGFSKMHPNQPITIKYQFVPISETLKQLLSDPGFRLETSKTTAEEGFLKDVKDGRSYMENSYFQQNKEAFTLILVSDDFEISNPLGARKGCYKVNNLYWTIAEIPKHQR